MHIDPSLTFLFGCMGVLSVQAAAMIVPGPNFLLLLTRSTQPHVHRLLVVLGIASAGVVFSVGTLAVLRSAASDWQDGMFLALNVIGVAYLAWMGVRLVVAGTKGPSGSFALGIDTCVKNTLPGAFLGGFLTNLANPKTLAFFASVLATALPVRELSMVQVVVVVVLVFLNSLVVHGLVAMLVTVKVCVATVEANGKYIMTMSGVLFVLFALVATVRLLA